MSISSKLEELEIEAKIHSAFHETSRKLVTHETANDINERNSKIQHTTCNTQPKPISGDKVSENKQDKAAIPNGQYCTKCQGVKKYNCNCPNKEEIRRRLEETFANCTTPGACPGHAMESNEGTLILDHDIIDD